VEPHGLKPVLLHKLRRACLRRSGSRLREAPASAGVGRSRRQAEPSEAHTTALLWSFEGYPPRIHPRSKDLWLSAKEGKISLDKQNGTNLMDIEVKLFATLRDYLPKGSSRFSCKMEVDGHTRVQDILERLKIPEDIPKIVLINGVHGKKEQPLKDGDVVSIFPPVAGG
jgi:molybdopterin synthase sulfur carrier subunit